MRFIWEDTNYQDEAMSLVHVLTKVIPCFNIKTFDLLVSLVLPVWYGIYR